MFSGSGAAHSFKDAGIFWSLLMVSSFMLQGADTVMKVCYFHFLVISPTIRFRELPFDGKFHILVGSHLSR